MRARLALALVAAFAFGACGRPKITETQRREALLDASEATFAVEIKDWKRAADNFAKAADLSPDTGDYWMKLGLMRIRLGDRPAARAAYKQAFDAYKDAFEHKPADTSPVISQAYILVLLGQTDQAREVLTKGAARRPDDPRLKIFIERHGLENMIADPNTKANSP
ncbi:MAG TPA: tetratricopeptide repeat protein [Opitutaceae bacterium]|jgi:Flp pilus assembly protein TadD